MDLRRNGRRLNVLVTNDYDLLLLNRLEFSNFRILRLRLYVSSTLVLR